MSLAAIIRNAHLEGQLLVTEYHSQWMELPEDQQVYSEEAIDFVTRWMRREFKHERKGRFSASEIGHSCNRRKLFSYAGAPKIGADLDSLHIMGSGTKGHLFWQMEGLSYPFDSPWLQAPEAWVYDPDYRVGGSIDGIIRAVGSPPLEIKTVAYGKFNRIQREDAPEYEHLLQLAVYQWLRNSDRASLVYDDRNTGLFHEFIVARDEKLEAEVIRRLNALNNWVADDLVPPMLDDCEMRQGETYRSCPYRKVCPKIKKKLSEVNQYVS